MDILQLRDICDTNGLTLDDARSALLDDYARLLIEWNQKINLISRKDQAHVLDRHILHSLTLRMPRICDYDFRGKRAADIGTGGGLPGIPLAIVTPDIRITLVDSIQKKIAADRDMIDRLRLTNVDCIANRAEELAKQPEHASRYDVIVTRAVAPLDDLLKWSRGLIVSGGTLFSLKGGDLEPELSRARRLSYVASVEVKPLVLSGYEEFDREEKKLVRVDLH
jgi:16S rRNA (guanine527-N7)-methyltransferase